MLWEIDTRQPPQGHSKIVVGVSIDNTAVRKGGSKNGAVRVVRGMDFKQRVLWTRNRGFMREAKFPVDEILVPSIALEISVKDEKLVNKAWCSPASIYRQVGG